MRIATRRTTNGASIKKRCAASDGAERRTTESRVDGTACLLYCCCGNCCCCICCWRKYAVRARISVRADDGATNDRTLLLLIQLLLLIHLLLLHILLLLLRIHVSSKRATMPARVPKAPRFGETKSHINGKQRVATQLTRALQAARERGSGLALRVSVPCANQINNFFRCNSRMERQWLDLPSAQLNSLSAAVEVHDAATRARFDVGLVAGKAQSEWLDDIATAPIDAIVPQIDTLTPHLDSPFCKRIHRYAIGKDQRRVRLSLLLLVIVYDDRCVAVFSGCRHFAKPSSGRAGSVFQFELRAC